MGIVARLIADVPGITSQWPPEDAQLPDNEPDMADDRPAEAGEEDVPDMAQGPAGIERARLRRAQRVDPDYLNIITCLEIEAQTGLKGLDLRNELARKIGSDRAAIVARSIDHNALKRDGLLGRKVPSCNGAGHALRVVIPAGGARAVEWNGKLRTLVVPKLDHARSP